MMSRRPDSKRCTKRRLRCVFPELNVLPLRIGVACAPRCSALRPRKPWGDGFAICSWRNLTLRFESYNSVRYRTYGPRGTSVTRYYGPIHALVALALRGHVARRCNEL